MTGRPIQEKKPREIGYPSGIATARLDSVKGNRQTSSPMLPQANLNKAKNVEPIDAVPNDSISAYFQILRTLSEDGEKPEAIKLQSM